MLSSGVADVIVVVTGIFIQMYQVWVGVDTVNVMLPVCHCVSVRFVKDGLAPTKFSPLHNVNVTSTHVAVLFQRFAYVTVHIELRPGLSN
jgi:hypothetical protein